MKKKVASLLLVLLIICIIITIIVCDNYKIGKSSLDQAINLDPSITVKEYSDDTNGNDINIQYPFVYNIPQEDKINQLVMDAIVENLYQYGSNISDLTLTADFEVTYAGCEILSIVFRGTSNLKSAAHPISFAFAINLSTKTATIIDVAKKYGSQDGFEQKIINNITSQVDSEVAKYFQEMSLEELRLTLQSKSASYYLKENGIGIILPIPHPLGDYTEIYLGDK